MKIKTSITLSEELVHDIDELFGDKKNRSQFIEEALRDYLVRQLSKKRDLADMDILNRKADKLNKEAADVLSYQVAL